MTPAVSGARSWRTAEAFWNIFWNPGVNIWSGMHDQEATAALPSGFLQLGLVTKSSNKTAPSANKGVFFLMIKANASCSNCATLAADCEASGPNFSSCPINKLDLIVCLYVRSCLAAEGQKPAVIERLIYSQKTCCTINRRRVVRDENISKLFKMIYSAPRSELDVKTHHQRGGKKCLKKNMIITWA